MGSSLSERWVLENTDGKIAIASTSVERKLGLSLRLECNAIIAINLFANCFNLLLDGEGQWIEELERSLQGTCTLNRSCDINDTSSSKFPMTSNMGIKCYRVESCFANKIKFWLSVGAEMIDAHLQTTRRRTRT